MSHMKQKDIKDINSDSIWYTEDEMSGYSIGTQMLMIHYNEEIDEKDLGYRKSIVDEINAAVLKEDQSN